MQRLCCLRTIDVKELRQRRIVQSGIARRRGARWAAGASDCGGGGWHRRQAAAVGGISVGAVHAGCAQGRA